MARIPTYTAERGLEVGNAISLPAMRNFEAEALQDIGQAVGSIRIGVGGRGRARKQPQARDSSWFSKVRAQTALDWAKPGADYSTYGAYRQKVLKDAPDPASKELYGTWSTGFGVELGAKAGQDKQAAAIGARVSNLTEALKSHVALVEADPDQYGSAVVRAVDDIDGADWLDEQDRMLLQRQSVADIQYSRARILAEAAPDQFDIEVGEGDSRYSLLDGAQIGELRKVADSAALAAVHQDEDRLNRGDPAVEMQGYDLLAGNNLTPEWLGANYSSLGPMARRALDRSVNPPAPSRPSARAELALLERAHSAGGNAVLDAAEAFASGEIDQAGFGRIHVAAGRAESAAPFVKAARQNISLANRPSSLASDAEFARHLDTLRSFDDWTTANPKATPKEVALMAEDLTGAERKSVGAMKVASLPIPRFVRAPSREMVRPEDLDAAKAETVAALQNRNISISEAEDAALILREWYSAIGNEVT